MEELFDPKAAKEYIINCFEKQGDFAFLGDKLAPMVEELLQMDADYMERCNARPDSLYDDDEAFELFFEEMKKAHPDYKTYMMRLVEDYMDYTEQYMESIGAIEWDN